MEAIDVIMESIEAVFPPAEFKRLVLVYMESRKRRQLPVSTNDVHAIVAWAKLVRVQAALLDGVLVGGVDIDTGPDGITHTLSPTGREWARQFVKPQTDKFIINISMNERACLQEHRGWWAMTEKPAAKVGQEVEFICLDKVVERGVITDILPPTSDTPPDWTGKDFEKSWWRLIYRNDSAPVGGV